MVNLYNGIIINMLIDFTILLVLTVTMVTEFEQPIFVF